MRSRATKSWYRKAVVAASILAIAGLGAMAWVLFPHPGDGTAEARLVSDGGPTPGVTSSLNGEPGSSGLRLCNKTGSRVGVAIGYKEQGTWVTEGWWNVVAANCETLMAGPLVSRFYYVHAIDYDQGGVWGGKAWMCTRDKMFTIKGIEDCVARGFEKTGFFEVDTGEQKSWTVQLTAPGETGTGGK
jgi:uncharacterized membrane protein